MSTQNAVITKAISYLLSQQRADGSWSGPLSPRMKETFQVNLLAKLAGWQKIEERSEKWIEVNAANKGASEGERLLNSQYLKILAGQTVDLTSHELYAPTVIRKTLQILAFALAAKSGYLLPAEYNSLEIVMTMIAKYLGSVQNNIKPWALAEFKAIQLIIASRLELEVSSLQDDLLALKDNSDNWYSNPNTTTTALIALIISGSQIKLDSFSEYFDKIETEGGWSFCELPIWDTGLALQSLNKTAEDADVIAAKAAAIAYIKQNQNSDGGWGFIPGLESEADTSSIVLAALAPANANDTVRNAEEYYRELQFKDGDSNGLWPVWRKSEIPSPEVVGHIIKALSDIHSELDLSLAKSWVQTKIETQDIAADWGRSMPYSIFSLLNIGVDVNTSNHLIQELLQIQNSDGGWGPYAKTGSNASATANAVMALKLVSNIEINVSNAIENGLSYLAAAQLPNGTWPRVTEVIGPRPFTYADDCSTHNFVLQALLTK